MARSRGNQHETSGMALLEPLECSAAPSASVAPCDAPSCWICLCGPEDAGEAGEVAPLIQPCRCPRHAHLKCLARWQLQSAGRSEESCCRFCHQVLPDWKSSLTPGHVQPITPVMAIKFEGRTYKLRVKPGPDGLREFQGQVRQLLGFNITEDFDVTFECQVPQTGERMKLTGLSSYGAATHCAAITAAQRDTADPALSSTECMCGSTDHHATNECLHRQGPQSVAYGGGLGCTASGTGPSSNHGLLHRCRGHVAPALVNAGGPVVGDGGLNLPRLSLVRSSTQVQPAALLEVLGSGPLPRTRSNVVGSTQLPGLQPRRPRSSAPSSSLDCTVPAYVSMRGVKGLVERTKRHFSKILSIWDA